MSSTRRRFLLSLGATAVSAPLGVRAQSHPGRPIALVVAYPAGGDTDSLARVFAEKLVQRLGSAVIVDNRPGASGLIGTAFVAKAPPDGHTLLVAPSTFSIAQLVLKNIGGSGYDPVGDFAPIIQTSTMPLFLVASGSSGLRGVKDVVAASRSGDLAYASPGAGSPMHILGEMVNKAAAMNLRHVPYRGVAPAINDVLGGHLPLAYITYGPVAPYLESGKLVALAVADRQRSPLAPKVPTFEELGFPGLEVVAWNGMFGPKGLPPELIRTLNGHMNEIVRLPEVTDRMRTQGALALGGAPDVMARTNAGDVDRFGRLIKEFGIQAD